jgi:hypothetical protein
MKEAEQWLRGAVEVEGPKLVAMLDASPGDPVQIVGEWAGQLALSAYEAGCRSASAAFKDDLAKRLQAERARCITRFDDDLTYTMHARYEGRVQAIDVVLSMLGAEVSP